MNTPISSELYVDEKEKHCPNCKSIEISFCGETEHDSNTIFQPVICNNCKTQWVDGLIILEKNQKMTREERDKKEIKLAEHISESMNVTELKDYVYEERIDYFNNLNDNDFQEYYDAHMLASYAGIKPKFNKRENK